MKLMWALIDEHVGLKRCVVFDFGIKYEGHNPP